MSTEEREVWVRVYAATIEYSLRGWRDDRWAVKCADLAVTAFNTRFEKAIGYRDSAAQ
jgi:hypothetical protein